MFNKLCSNCGEPFTTSKPDTVNCSFKCFVESRTIPGKPKHLIVDDSPCRIWQADKNGDIPIIVVNDSVVELRKLQIDIPDGKRINLSCGNKMCVNELHYELVDDFSQFGYI